MFHRRWVVPAAVFLVIWTLTTHGKFSVSGDEPHYLLVTHSLWADGDYDLRNNHAAGDSRFFGVEGLQPGLHVRETRNGALYPVHDVGMPTLLVPAYAAATTVAAWPSDPLLVRMRMSRGLFAYSLLSLLLIALSAWAALLTRDAVVAAGVSPSLAAASVLALWLAPPVLSISFLVFPEVFALLITAWAVRIGEVGRTRAVLQADRKGPSHGQLLAFVLATAALPWLHRKFVFYAALLIVAVLWPQRDMLRTLTGRARAALIACLVVPPALLAMWTLYHWGNLGGALTLDGVPLSWGAFQRGVIGLLVDRENGVLVWAPIYLLVPAALMLARRDHRVWIPALAALFLVSAAHDQWWAGFSPAARFLMPAAPLVAVMSVAALERRRIRSAAAVLLVPTLIIAAYGWQNPRALWPRGDGENRTLSALLPDGAQQWLPSIRPREP